MVSRAGAAVRVRHVHERDRYVGRRLYIRRISQARALVSGLDGNRAIEHDLRFARKPELTHLAWMGRVTARAQVQVARATVQFS